MNGCGNGSVVPSMVTWFSCIASSRADCVLAGARLTSSASSTWQKIGPLRRTNSFCLAVEDVGAGHVGRQQVGRELDALILHAEDAGEGLGQRGLGDAGHAFEQDVAAGQQGDEELMRDRLHADDDAADLRQRARAQLLDP